MKQYALSTEAQHDLDDIRVYYLKRATAQVARQVIREITAGFRFLAANPGAGHPRTDLTNEPVKFWQVFSYLIVYDYGRQPIGIARVIHTGRDLKTLFQSNPPRA